jgi:membrane protein implicated in regulation of membrane protease activity
MGGETMELYLMFATVCALLVFLHQKEQQHKEERKDLLDRIMARDYVEYKEQTTEPVKYEPVTVTEEDEYWREIEERKL